MRTGAAILGLLGALLAFPLTACAVGLVGTAEALGGGSGWVTFRAILGFLFSLSAIVGAGMAFSNPKPGGVVMLGSAAGGVLSVGVFWGFSALLLVIAGILALFSGGAERAKA